ncbi:MAG TPA: hypothetical protein VD790_10250 [Thermoleophilaceae bacterium]|nr:hypothetical protein [Thermoleophilaceae bacterium]
MAGVTLAVPAEFAEDFRAALVREIAFDVGQIEDDEKARAERLAGSVFAEKFNEEDVRYHRAQLDADMALAAQAGIADTGAIELTETGAPGQLAHICEAMAQQVVQPQIARALEIAPLDDATALRPMIASLTWAVENAESLFGELARRAEAA